MLDALYGDVQIDKDSVSKVAFTKSFGAHFDATGLKDDARKFATTLFEGFDDLPPDTQGARRCVM